MIKIRLICIIRGNVESVTEKKRLYKIKKNNADMNTDIWLIRREGKAEQNRPE
jgi:hypothetical protein